MDHLDRAYQLLEFRRYREAIQEAQSVLSGGEEAQFGAYEVIAMAHLYEERPQAALPAIQAGLRLGPYAPTFYYLHSWYQELVGEPEKAMEAVNEGLKLFPKEEILLEQKVHLMIRARAYPDVLDVIGHALEIYPDSAFFHAHHAAVLSDLGKPQAALQSIGRALDIEPENARYIALMARLKNITGSSSKDAEAIALQSLRTDPEDEFARNTLLEIYRNKNGLLRFFVGHGFSRYQVKWGVGRVILMILFWKGVLLWGGFFLLYIFVTWYGSVLYNSIIRLNARYKALLSPVQLRQSDYFLALNSLLLLPLAWWAAGQPLSPQWGGCLALLLLALFVGISYFELDGPRKHKGLVWFAVPASLLLMGLLVQGLWLGVILASVFLLLLYAFLFTLNVLY